MESLKTMFHRMQLVSEARSETQTATGAPPPSKPPAMVAECSICRDIGWLLTNERDRDNMPMTVACLDCERGIEEWRRTVGIKPGERIPTFGDFNPALQSGPDRTSAIAALKEAAAWMAGDLHGLALSGPVGVGKSHLAKAALWHAAKGGIRGRYMTMARFDWETKDFEAKPWVQERRRQVLFAIPRLVIDDVGSGNRENSAWVRERLSEMFDERYRAGAGTLLTTNLTEPEFVAAIGIRSWDRLSENGRLIYMPGESQRGKA